VLIQPDAKHTILEFVLAIYGMKVRSAVLPIIDVDNNSKKPADFRHEMSGP
jgi:hypothetical protein